MAAFDSFVFEHATVLDGSASMEPQADMSVVVERGVITRVEPTRQVEAPSGARIVDVSGAYLLPGLINMHVHFCGSGKPTSAGDAGAS